MRTEDPPRWRPPLAREARGRSARGLRRTISALSRLLMARYKDYYRILGVTPTASADDIKAAYRKLARTYHPDVNKAADAQDRFVEIGEAYEALGDPQKRAAYDRIRQMGFSEGQEIGEMPPPGGEGGFRGGEGGNGFESGHFTEMDPEAFSEFFQSMFGHGMEGGMARGRGSRRRRSAFQERGEDVQHAIEVTLEEAYRGGERRLQMEVPEADEHGRLTRSTRTLDVRIPSGVVAGSRIRLKGQGEPGGTPDAAGDLYLEVRLQQHRLFTAEGRTIHLSLPVAPWEAVLGATIEVPTLGGPVQLKIPPGSQAGERLRLRGRGLPGEPPGDEIVTLVIAVPQHPGERERELYRQLAAASGEFHPRARLGA
jgi:curved DNA-binding protein